MMAGMVADRTKFVSDQLTALARNIVQLHGGDPLAFRVTETHDGVVSVLCSGTTAIYPQEAWTAKFTRHLLRGFFRPCGAPVRAKDDGIPEP